VQVPLVDGGSGLLGVSVDSAGTVFDESTFRLHSNLGEGFGAQIRPGATGILLHTWALGADDVPILPDADRETISVTSEGASPLGTLVIPAGWTVTKTSPSEAQVTRHEFEAGYVRTEARSGKYRPRWKLSGIVDRNALGTLEAFWDNHKGGEIPFNWTDPQGAAHVAHFVEGFRKTKLSPEAWKFDAEIEVMNE